MQKSGLIRYFGMVAFIAFLVFSLGQAGASPLLVEPPSNQVAVKPKPGVSIGAILGRYNATLLGTITETNLHFLQLPEGQTAAQILPALNADADILYAEPNYYADGSPDGKVIFFRAHWSPQGEVIFFRAHEDATATSNGGQWAWDKIKLGEAQGISKGKGIIVAVLDTGLAADHPMLNSSLTAGYDFVGQTNGIYDTGNGLDDDGDGLVDEELGHGTHVSGIILTVAPEVQIMPIRVLNSDGVGTYWEVAAGIRYAVDHGAKVINLSLSAPRLTPSLAEALDYAAAHGVLVVSAAGTGSGPNYPAAYTNPLAVLGVAASDSSDTPAWFTGGQAIDTDVYAPGVDIYSAYPYNNYVAASGTSMAAPIVAAEAALLMSRYPSWTPLQVAQRIVSKTMPISSAAQGRIDLSAALNTGLAADYAVGDIGVPNNNAIVPRIRLNNNTSESIPLNQITLRYWYTAESGQPQGFGCDFSTTACAHLTGNFTHMNGNDPNRTLASDTYLEIGFSEAAGSLAPGGRLEMLVRANKNNWSDYAEADDYSYNATLTTLSPWDRITVYRNGELRWGHEPAGSAPAAPSNTPTQAQTSTPTATRVVESPTLEPTKPPAQTPAPPTLTPQPSALPTGSLQLKYMQTNASGSSQSINPHFILVNNGAIIISLKKVKIRYWFTVDGERPQNHWCDYAALGCSKIKFKFVKLDSGRNKADTYLEISFTGGAGDLAPGASTGVIQNRFSKDNWSAYAQGNDYSFNASLTQFTAWPMVTVYLDDTLVWGVEP